MLLRPRTSTGVAVTVAVKKYLCEPFAETNVSRRRDTKLHIASCYVSRPVPFPARS